MALTLLSLSRLALAADEQAPSAPSTSSDGLKSKGEETGATAPAEDRYPALLEIVSKIFLAYGGKEALSQYERSSVIYGVLKTTAEEKVDFRQTSKGNKLRVDQLVKGGGTEGGAQSAITVFDGKSAWKVANNRVVALDSETAHSMAQENLRSPAIFTHFNEPGYEFKLLGPTQYRQIPVMAIEARSTWLSPTTFFVDQNNYLIHAISYSMHNGADSVMIDLAEYRPAGGTMVAFKQSKYLNGQPLSELTLGSINFSGTIDDAFFTRPGQPPAVSLRQPASLPFQYAHQQIFVKARINGGEWMDYLLDTGASDTIIDRRTAAEHYLDKQGNLNIAAAAGSVSTQSSLIRKLEFGNVSLEQVPALVLDLSPQSQRLGRRIAGMIGANVLSRFTVTIDYGRLTITLRDPSTYKPGEGASLVPFVAGRGPIVKAVLNGNDEQAFLVDTGAAFNHLQESAARRYVQGQPLNLTEGTGLDGRPVRLGTTIVDVVELGTQKVSKVKFTYPYQQAPPVDRGGFFQATNVGVLGNPFWQNFVVTLDYKSQRLALSRNVARKTAQEINSLITTGDTKLIIHRDFRAAEAAYQKALASARDVKEQARLWGRLGNLRRVMAKDLKRPEQSKVAYDYFNRAQAAALKVGDREVQARILADWSLLYSDSGQAQEARSTIESALALAPQDPQVNVDYAVHLYRAQSFPRMQQYIDKALFLDPSNWQALWYQVKLSEMFLDRARLRATLKEILRFYPWSKLASGKLAAIPAQAAPASPAKAQPAGKVLPGAR